MDTEGDEYGSMGLEWYCREGNTQGRVEVGERN